MKGSGTSYRGELLSDTEPITTLWVNEVRTHKDASVKVEVWLPRVLRPQVGGQSRVTIQGSNVGDILRNLVDLHPLVGPHILDGEGNLQPYISVFRNETNIRDLEHLQTSLAEADELRILPAVAGG